MENIERDKKTHAKLEEKSDSDKYREGLETYKKVLLAYRDWLQEQEDKGNTDTPEMARESLRRHFFINGMVVALGLTEQEEIAIMKEIGFTGSIVKKHSEN
ncbi:MAG: hypothetical protein HYT61_00235 [Candidatus Yanofskybacteria bacterium]|nr:hypothetical protein [Candidatus Yanofskybacteria bacterium]